MRDVLAGAIIGTVAGVLGALLVECAPPAPAEQITVTTARKLTDEEDLRCACRREAREAGHSSVYFACLEAGK